MQTTEALAEGDYVQLEVSDTGSGMSHEIQARIFDPFFSTKSAGRGLGLPVIHGIVRSLRGAIRVRKRGWQGHDFSNSATFGGNCGSQRSATLSRVRSKRCTDHLQATVLVVEDEAPLRVAVKKMLGNAGFTVLEAADGSEAVELLRSKASGIDLLFLDMTIPGCSSQEVLREAVKGWPEVKVILTSAYSEEMVTRNLNAPQVRGFVRKPFQIGTLLSMLRSALSS